MKLTGEQTDSARAILRSNEESFLYLLRVAGLDPARVLPGADLRGVVFTREDDLTGLDFSRCDLRGTDFTRAIGVDQAVFADSISDETTRGLPAPHLYVDLSIENARDMILQGNSPPHKLVPFIIKLDLSNAANFRDLTPLAGLFALQGLDLSGTGITDLTPLAGLSALQGLDLSDTAVADLKPLAGLSALGNLYLSGTNVRDLTPLAGLFALRGLDLKNSAVTDIRPLAGLFSLQGLYLDGTGVTDLTPLSGLSALRGLTLNGTNVTDLTPLASLTVLQLLHLNGSEVTDLTPLAGLTLLRMLDLTNVKVSTIAPLNHLKNLTISGYQHNRMGVQQNLFAVQKWNRRVSAAVSYTPPRRPDPAASK